ncbi:MAG: DUF4959 domain-containing protein [Tannerella sp.]|nr:DUF4959 domain-containing protein [Tannerella sp.]
MVIVVPALLFAQCEEETNRPVDSDGSAPGQVTNVSEIPLSGGAELHYSLPYDVNLAYVEAEVTTPEGRQMNFKASSYISTITVLGLSTDRAQEVLLYSVGNSGARSEAIRFTMHPLEPPFRKVFRTLGLSETWSGVKLKYRNEPGVELAFLLGYIDDHGEFADYDGYYPLKVSTDSAFIYRGLPAVPRRYAVYIRDRWDNYSDTLYTDLTPWHEEEINKGNWRKYILDNDGPFYPVGHQYYEISKMENLWDGAWSKSFSDPYMEQLPSSYLSFTLWDGDGAYVDNWDPKSMTFDIGDNFRISRVRVNHYWQYRFSAARRWEVWGCVDAPPQDGSWSWPGWVKLADMEQIKPSGLPGETYGEGDAEAWEAGTSADIEAPDAVRYIRFRCLESWAKEPLMNCAEITLYGTKNMDGN